MFDVASIGYRSSRERCSSYRHLRCHEHVETMLLDESMGLTICNLGGLWCNGAVWSATRVANNENDSSITSSPPAPPPTPAVACAQASSASSTMEVGSSGRPSVSRMPNFLANEQQSTASGAKLLICRAQQVGVPFIINITGEVRKACLP